MGDGGQNPYVGIFADEKNVQFKCLLEAHADRIFRELHCVILKYNDNEVGLDAPETYLNADYINQFRVGLGSIEGWSPAILDRQVAQLTQDCAIISYLCRYAAITYIKIMHKDQPRKKIDVQLPSLKDFLYRFFTRLARENVVQNGQYFQIGVMDKDILIMNAIRAVLNASLSPYVNVGSEPRGGAFAEPITPASSVPPTPQVPTPASVPPTPFENDQQRRSAFRQSMNSALQRMKAEKSAKTPSKAYAPSTPTPGPAQAKTPSTRPPTLRELQSRARSVAAPNITIDVETLGKPPRQDRDAGEKASEKASKKASKKASEKASKKASEKASEKASKKASEKGSRAQSVRSKKPSAYFFDSDEDEPTND